MMKTKACFNRFDICEAYYAYGVAHHTGQFSKEWASIGRLCLVGFRPSFYVREYGYAALTENGKIIYNNLKQRVNPNR
jgi:hypothetical protein